MHWWALEEDEVLRELGTRETGLSTTEAEERLTRYGPNELPVKEQSGLLGLFVSQLKEVMVLVLIGAAVVALLAGEMVDATVILFIVFMNAVLGTYQEYKAERSLAALRNLAAPECVVVRAGKTVTVAVRDLVPGDIVLLEEGNFVPADLRLVEAANLAVDEAALTGESLPVSKQTGSLASPDVPLADRTNMVYRGTVVSRGRGRGVVCAIGSATEVGRIAGQLQEDQREVTPLQRRLDRVGRTLAALVLAISAVMFVVGLLRGEELLQTLLTSVSLAVAAIPEGLPAVVTVVLALGVQRMAKRHVIIRHLPAVETLGSASVICTDKTGTLTQNQMTVRRVYTGTNFEVEGVGYAPEGAVRPQPTPDVKALIMGGLLCNNARLEEEEPGHWRLIGDPTEGALLPLAAKAGLNKSELADLLSRVDEIPFDSERKRMTTLHQAEHFLAAGYSAETGLFPTDTKFISFTKGAPELLLPLCTHYLDSDGKRAPLTKEVLRSFQDTNTAWAGRALRVLAVACRAWAEKPSETKPDVVERDLTMLGLVGMQDPARPEAAEAVRLCRRAGIRPVMITGDHRDTAVAIASDLALLGPGERALAGAELGRLSQEQLEREVDRIAVYARVSPEDKQRIVRAWQKNQHVVAMTGDGINDAPAMKQADIGVAMGQGGTDVARETADMVLTDDNFASIVAAVAEGRVIYSNIKKAILYLLSCNFGEVIVVAGAMLAGLPLPLLPVHILWVNLVTDSLPALALGVDPPEPGLMDEPPRSPNEQIFTRLTFLNILAVGALIALSTGLAFWWGLVRDHSLVRARTMAFAALALAQIAQALNSRSQKLSLFTLGLKSNPHLLGAAAVSIAAQAIVITVPAASRVLRTEALTVSEWLVVAALSLTPIVVIEAVKMMRPHLARAQGKEP